MEQEIKKIKDWLSLPALERDFEKGALLFLKNNPKKRILYDNIVRRQFVEKLEYELKKTLTIMEAKYDSMVRGIEYSKLSPAEVADFNSQEKQIEVTLPQVLAGEETKGKRPDHDALPPEIQTKFDENIKIYPQMRALHEKCKLLVNEPASERYPFVKKLIDLDEQLTANWAVYDQFNPEDPAATAPEIVIDFNRINADRKYISDNKEKLATLKADPEQEDAYNELKAKVQQRIDELLSVNQGISEDQAAILRELGLTVGSAKETSPEQEQQKPAQNA
jgi:hypothetical protein